MGTGGSRLRKAARDWATTMIRSSGVVDPPERGLAAYPMSRAGATAPVTAADPELRDQPTTASAFGEVGLTTNRSRRGGPEASNLATTCSSLVMDRGRLF